MRISSKTGPHLGVGLGNLSRRLLQNSAAATMALVAMTLVGAGCLSTGWGPPPGANPPPTTNPPPTNPPPVNPPPGAPELCEEVAAEGVLAVTTSVDSGLGISSVTTTIHNCTFANVEVLQDCCYGPNIELERSVAGGAWEEIPHAFECDCFGPIDPIAIDAWGEATFDAWPDDWELCNIGFAEYRWTYWVRGLDEESNEYQPVIGTPFGMYCEG